MGIYLRTIWNHRLKSVSEIYHPEKIYQKEVYQGNNKVKHQWHTNVDSVSFSDSCGWKSRLELNHFSLMYEKSSQKLLTDDCYQERVIKEFKNFSATLDKILPYYKLFFPVVNYFIFLNSILFFRNIRIPKKLNKRNTKIQQSYSHRYEPAED